MLIACPKSILKNNEKLFNHAKLSGKGLNGKIIIVSIIKMFILD
jgi:hypothetical protein